MCDESLSPWRVGIGPPETNELFLEFMKRYVREDFHHRLFNDMSRQPIRHRYFVRPYDVSPDTPIELTRLPKQVARAYLLNRENGQLEVRLVDIPVRVKLRDVLWDDDDTIMILEMGKTWQCYFRNRSNGIFFALLQKGESW